MPLAGFSYKSNTPVRFELNTMRLPSADQIGPASAVPSDVKRFQRPQSEIEDPDIEVAIDGSIQGDTLRVWRERWSFRGCTISVSDRPELPARPIEPHETDA
jgi:hypothetical protein